MKSDKKLKKTDDGKDVSILDLVTNLIYLRKHLQNSSRFFNFFKFKYADNTDVVLLILGVFAALASAGLYPMMFFFYGKIAGTLVDYEKYRKKLELNLTSDQFSQLFNNSKW